MTGSRRSEKTAEPDMMAVDQQEPPQLAQQGMGKVSMACLSNVLFWSQRLLSHCCVESNKTHTPQIYE